MIKSSSKYWAQQTAKQRKPGRLKRARALVTSQKTGKPRVQRVTKTIPKKCSTPRRICLVCQKNSIHKLSKNYDSKVCSDCKAKQTSEAPMQQVGQSEAASYPQRDMLLNSRA